MKLAPVIVLCLAVSIHQATSKPLFLEDLSGSIRAAGSAAEGIVGAAGSAASGAAGTAGDIAAGIAKGASGAAQGAIGAATGIAKGVIGVKAGIDAAIVEKLASVTKVISEKVKSVRNAALKGALQNAQNTLQKIQDHTRGVLQESEVAAKNAEEGLIEVEDEKNQLIQEWADKAKEKLANASPETKEKGDDLIAGFVDNRSEAIKQASDKALKTLEHIQEQAHATADKYHEPMNKLIEQVGKCSELKASQVRELVKCAGEIRKDLAPLASAPGALASIKAQLAKAAAQSIVKDIKVQKALRQFRDQSKQVELILDQMVAQDQKNQEQQPKEDEAAVNGSQENEGDAPKEQEKEHEHEQKQEQEQEKEHEQEQKQEQEQEKEHEQEQKQEQEQSEDEPAHEEELAME